MKKFLSFIMAIMIGATLVACGDNKEKDNKDPEPEKIVDEIEKPETSKKDEADKAEKEDKNEQTEKQEESDKQTADETVKEDGKTEENKPAESKPEQNKPAENKPAESKPEQSKPVETPSSSNKTVGNTLLDVFKTNAKAGKSTDDIVAAISEKLSSQIMLVPNPVAPGDYLPGFDEAEIKGYKSGVAFMPMIGSIPFVGYVFDLDGTVSASDFVSKLKSNANLRWLICAEAEEMVTGSEGNKVFFVMCPKSLEG
ncbi:MAG: hypothetical protein E7415_04425 [Ruminococcaceae bacterium]|nr:hypothetical protein [Oscillospiraceae bacterium]